jgi:hypothetical protein
VVFTLTYPFTRPPLIAALSHYNIAWDDSLTAKDFYTKTTTS